MSIPEGYGDDEAGPGCACPRAGLRDVAAAYLVHAGLRLATRDVRNRMMMIISEEWRAAVGRALSMSRHPAGKGGQGPARPGGARPDGARPNRAPVRLHGAHLADRMDAAYRARRRTE